MGNRFFLLDLAEGEGKGLGIRTEKGQVSTVDQVYLEIYCLLMENSYSLTIIKITIFEKRIF